MRISVGPSNTKTFPISERKHAGSEIGLVPRKLERDSSRGAGRRSQKKLVTRLNLHPDFSLHIALRKISPSENSPRGIRLACIVRTMVVSESGGTPTIPDISCLLTETQAGWHYRHMKPPKSVHDWLAAIGSKGGSVTSKAKAAAARRNGRKGGRPRKAKS